MNSTEQLFFATVKSAVGAERIEGSVSLSPSQWRRLYRISLSQNLGTIVFQELSRLGNNIPDELFYEWKKHSGYCLARFDAQLMALTHLSQFLEEHGIRTMVLKGLGLALLYTDPQSRECSDVDIFCFGEYERVNTLLLQSRLIESIEEENDKHCSFSFDGVNIENHRYFSEYVNHANKLIGNEIYNLREEGLITDTRIPGILFPGAHMGALHIIMHTLSHLAWSGITVRHLLDCALFFNRHMDDFDHNQVIRLWKEAKIEDAAIALCVLCENVLGIKTGMTENNNQKHQKIAKKMLDGILSPPQASAAVRNPFIKFVRKYRQFRYRSAMHPIVYGEPFPDSFWESFTILNP